MVMSIVVVAAACGMSKPLRLVGIAERCFEADDRNETPKTNRRRRIRSSDY